MNELIHIYENDGQYSKDKQAVSARELYEKLEFAPQHWANWYKKNILKNEFAIEGEDYIQLPLSGRTLDFALSLNFAKKLSMRANTAKGNEARDYFIEREKISYQPQKVLSPIEILEYSVKQLKEQNTKINIIESKVNELEAKITTSDAQFYAILGFANLQGLKIDKTEAIRLGKIAGKLSREMGVMIGKTYDCHYGAINTYHVDVLNEVFKNKAA